MKIGKCGAEAILGRETTVFVPAVSGGGGWAVGCTCSHRLVCVRTEWPADAKTHVHTAYGWEADAVFYEEVGDLPYSPTSGQGVFFAPGAGSSTFAAECGAEDAEDDSATLRDLAEVAEALIAADCLVSEAYAALAYAVPRLRGQYSNRVLSRGQRLANAIAREEGRFLPADWDSPWGEESQEITVVREKATVAVEARAWIAAVWAVRGGTNPPWAPLSPLPEGAAGDLIRRTAGSQGHSVAFWLQAEVLGTRPVTYEVLPPAEPAEMI